MAFEIKTQQSWDKGKWGYYQHMVDGSCQYIQINQYADPGYDASYLIKGIQVFAFSDFHGQWWIGADFSDQRNRFQLMGPYADHEEACTFIVLYGTRYSWFAQS